MKRPAQGRPRYREARIKCSRCYGCGALLGEHTTAMLAALECIDDKPQPTRTNP